MFEYLTGGQCYKCGGKVKYPDGGMTEQPISPEEQMMMGQPQPNAARTPTTMDAYAEQLLGFLIDQLNKGTSDKILKKMLIDSGVSESESEDLISVAKEEFDITGPERDIQEQEFYAASQAEDDINMEEEDQEDDDTPFEQLGEQARYGGSMRKIKRMNAGGNTCPAGYFWDDTMGSCVPAGVTNNIASQGATANISGVPQQAPNTTEYANFNLINARHQAKSRAEQEYLGNAMNSYNAGMKQKREQSMKALGDLYTTMRSNNMDMSQAMNKIQSQQTQASAQTAPQQTAKYGGLKKFLVGGEDDPYFVTSKNLPGSDKNTVPVTPASSNYSWSNPTFNPNNLYEAPPSDVKVINTADPSKGTPYVPAESRQPLQVQQNQNTNNQQYKNNVADNKNNVADNTPVDPRKTGNPYIVYTDKNKLANLDPTWVNKALAVGNTFGDPRLQALLPSEGFGAGLKFLLGAGAAASGFGLLGKRLLAKDKSRVYDDKGNLFDEKGNLIARGSTQQNNSTTSEPPANTSSTPIATSPRTAEEQASYDPDMEDVKKQGGEWNPFVDNRRKLKIGMQLYVGGGPVDFDTWLQDTGNFQTMGNEMQLQQQYQAYVDSFNAQNKQPQQNQNTVSITPPPQNMTAPGGPASTPPANNTNNNAGNTGSGTVNTKEYKISGPGSAELNQAVYTYSGIAGSEDVASARAVKKQMTGLGNAAYYGNSVAARQRRAGNTDEMATEINPVQPYGSEYAVNAGLGANQGLSAQGHTQSAQETMATARLGGMYKKGGTYNVSLAELMRIINMGGQVEFLD